MWPIIFGAASLPQCLSAAPSKYSDVVSKCHRHFAKQILTAPMELFFNDICGVSFVNPRDRTWDAFAKPPHRLVGLVECELLGARNLQCYPCRNACICI